MPTGRFALCVCSDIRECASISPVLAEFNLDVLYTVGLQNARGALADKRLSLVFCEDRLPDGSYPELLRALKDRPDGVPVIVSSCQADWDNFLEAMRLGAFDVVRRPYRPTEVKWVTGNALTQRHWPPSRMDESPLEPLLTGKG